jgi:predicted enzyme related to lactoylglutathione lyase
MFERAGFPAGVPCFIDLSPPDPAAATRFYGPLMGWTFEDRMPPEAPGHFFAARLDGREVTAISSPAPDPDPAPAPPAWTTYVAVQSADAAAARVWEAGGTVITEPFDVFEAGRMADCADPQGASFCLWQAGRHRGAELVNAPGSWNWSDLRTDDPEGAKAFYAAVFGWETSDLDLGGMTATMWRRPGYGDALAERESGIRERQAEAGAPAGFEDAIGWLLPLDDGAAPHWAVTFAVDGTDAVVESAAELGATVLTAPYDAGPVRIAVLRDPQGADFTVSTYAPQG